MTEIEAADDSGSSGGGNNSSGGEHMNRVRVTVDPYRNPPCILRTTQERFSTWTESLGSESFNVSTGTRHTGAAVEDEDIIDGTEGGTDQSPGRRLRSSKKREKKSSTTSSSGNWLDMSKFSPLLSTLNKNGRPRFDYIKNGDDNGRLQMMMVPHERPQLVALQTPPMRDDNRLQMIVLLIKTREDGRDDHHPQDHDEDRHIQDESCHDDDDRVGDHQKMPKTSCKTVDGDQDHDLDDEDQRYYCHDDDHDRVAEGADHQEYGPGPN